MRSKPLIVPGYIVGLGSLFIITYRTLLAFFSNSKSITVNINRFGEQHLDIFFLIIIWAICLIGLIYLFRYLKEEKTETIPKQNISREPIITRNDLYLYGGLDSSVYEKTEFQFDVLMDASKEINTTSYLSDDGMHLLVSYNSINSVEDN